MKTILHRLQQELTNLQLKMLIETRLENDRMTVYNIFMRLNDEVKRMMKEMNLSKKGGKKA